MVCRSRYLDDPTLSVGECDARRQVATLRRFYQHVLLFVVVNAGLLAVNLIASPGHLWAFWPLLGWGVWLALHAFATFARDRWLGAEWEQRKLRELMAGKAMK